MDQRDINKKRMFTIFNIHLVTKHPIKIKDFFLRFASEIRRTVFSLLLLLLLPKQYPYKLPQ